MEAIYTSLILIALGYIFIIYRRGDLDKDIEVVKRISKGLLMWVKKLWLIRPSLNTSNVSDKFKRYLLIFLNLSIFILVTLIILSLIVFVLSIIIIFLIYGYIKRLVLNFDYRKPKIILSSVLKFIFVIIVVVVITLFDEDDDLVGDYSNLWPMEFKIIILQKNYEIGKVSRVIDGDTIKLDDGRTIRYLGVDTPETVHPTKSEECYGKEASNMNNRLVDGEKVILIKGMNNKDYYGRDLRYIITADNKLFVNQFLVSEGFGSVPDQYRSDNIIRVHTVLKGKEQQARMLRRGMWGKCSY